MNQANQRNHLKNRVIIVARQHLVQPHRLQLHLLNQLRTTTTTQVKEPDITRGPQRVLAIQVMATTAAIIIIHPATATDNGAAKAVVRVEVATTKFEIY